MFTQGVIFGNWKTMKKLIYEIKKKVVLLDSFFLLALQPPLGVVFYSPLVGFSLLACEVS